MEELQLEHTSGQWRIFTDSSNGSLKAVLLDNGKREILLSHSDSAMLNHKNRP